MQDFKNYREANALSFPVTSNIVATILEWREARLASAGVFTWDEDLGYHMENGDLVIRWTRVRASSKLDEQSQLPADELRKYYQEWEDFVDGINADAPPSLGNAMQVVEGEGPANKWIYMVVQELYVSMALSGIGIGLAIAFVVLLLSTHNLIITILCIITICCVLICVVGSTVAMGWQLGSVEALCFMTLTGFSVDYVVHLAHSYMKASSGSSLERTHAALQEMGISVFWGMATSFVASLVLFTCHLQVMAAAEYSTDLRQSS
jgi:predicted RND superfamily exporter protein